MAKQQLVIAQTPTSKKRTITVALVVIALLAFVIKDPAGAADLATDIGDVLGGVLNGVVTFFGALN